MTSCKPACPKGTLPITVLIIRVIELAVLDFLPRETRIKIVQQNFGIGIWLVISTSKLFSLKSSSKFMFKGSLKNTQLKVKRLAGDSNF